MAFCIGGGGAVCSNSSTRQTLLPSIFSSSSSSFSCKKRNYQVVCAKKLSSRTGKFDSKNRRSGSGITTTPTKQVVEEEEELSGENQIVDDDGTDDELSIPVLPGEEPDFWEGPQWETFGFVIQYLWAFGLVFALIGCGIAVATYNEGATDFKQTPVYKESMESRELLEEPESSNSDVFEANPTEEAPSLE